MSAKTCVKVTGGPASTSAPEPPALDPEPLLPVVAPELLPVALVPEPLPLSFPLEPELLPVVLPDPDTLPLVTDPLALPLVPLSAPEVAPETFVVPEVVFPAVLPAPELPDPPELLPDSPPGNVAGDELHATKRQPVPMERAAIAKLVRNEVVIEFSLSRGPVGKKVELARSIPAGLQMLRPDARRPRMTVAGASVFRLACMTRGRDLRR
jgi:hypothetical protein